MTRIGYRSTTLTIGNTTFVWGSRTYVMGIVNLTPNSFSGDGVLDMEAMLERGRPNGNV